MDHPPICKPQPSDVAVRPNLVEDAQLARSINWQSLEQELGLKEDTNYNLAYAAIDRHAAGRGGKPALLWEGKSGEREQYTFADLSLLTNRFANVLLAMGVKKGDRVFLFMERIPELYVAIFGALKIGAVV
ncbi:MAG: acetate--CoA ligase, partial [Deltaproteobacteria bacterium]